MATNPDSTQSVTVTNTQLGVVTSATNELGKTTAYVYDTNGRLTDVTYPEGNKETYTYDARGNITLKRLISKTPGTPADRDHSQLRCELRQCADLQPAVERDRCPRQHHRL